MKIEFLNVRNGWGIIKISHRYHREMVTFNPETKELTIEKENEFTDYSGEFTVSYVENPIDILLNLKNAAENFEDCTISFDAEGKDSTIYLRNYAGEFFEMLWRNEENVFGGIPVVKQSEILDALSELMDFVNKNRGKIEREWGDSL